MAITVNYAPFQAIAEGFYGIGQGQGQQQRYEDSLREQQFAMQTQQAAAQDAYRQQALAADVYGRQQALGANLANQVAARQFDFMAGQQQQANRMELAGFGAEQDAQRQKAMFAHQQQMQAAAGMMPLIASEMDNIARMELAGWGYTPEQQTSLRKLEADRHSARTDEAAGPKQIAYVESEYWRKRIRIKPEQPAPKPPQQRFEEQLVRMQHPETGEVVFGMLGERKGAPIFNPVKFPGDAAKAEAEQLKQQQKDIAAQAAAEKQRLKDEQAATRAMYVDYRSLAQSSAKIDTDLRTVIAKLPSAQQAAEKGIMNYDRDAIAQQLAATAMQQQQALQRTFVRQHGKVAQSVDPDLAAEFGLPPLSHGWEADPEQFQQQVAQLQDEPGMAGFGPGPMATAPGFGYRDPSGGTGWQPFMSAQDAPAQLPPEIEQAARERVVAAAPAARSKLKLLERKFGGRPPASAPEEQQVYDAMKRIVDEAAQSQVGPSAPPSVPAGQAPTQRRQQSKSDANQAKSGMESILGW